MLYGSVSLGLEHVFILKSSFLVCFETKIYHRHVGTLARMLCLIDHVDEMFVFLFTCLNFELHSTMNDGYVSYTKAKGWDDGKFRLTKAYTNRKP